jgi:DNA-directed RNA polymerase subunit RPC12/RpoP
MKREGEKMILYKQKYKCKKCGNTFITTEGCIPGTNVTCQECGGRLEWDKATASDYINPLESIKALKHDVKSFFSYFSKTINK